MSTKNEAKRSREERLAQARKAQKATERRRAFVLYGAAAVALLIIAGAVFWAISRDSGGVARGESGDIQGVESYEYDAAQHVPGTVDYAETPPVGGKHNERWLNCGVYTEPVPDENAVHSLEHGAVWITYQPDLPEADVEKLQDLLPSTYTLISPYEGMDTPIAISAWGKQLKVDSADDPRLAEFVKEYRQGPQTPEPGAACTGGVGA